MSLDYKYKKVKDTDENFDNIQKQIDIWHKDFSISQYSDSLTENERNNALFTLSTFAEMMYKYRYEFPDEWSEEAMQEVLCDLFPKKLSVGLQLYENVENILRNFFTFQDLNHLIVPLKRYCQVMIEESKDRVNWGIAKKMVMSAMDIGVDLDDEASVNQFVENYTKIQMAKSMDNKGVKGLKVGRNDPCPCRSGKKYKKCCGK